MRYDIEYSPDTVRHLRILTARQRALVFDGVDEQLSHQPTVETGTASRCVRIRSPPGSFALEIYASIMRLRNLRSLW